MNQITPEQKLLDVIKKAQVKMKLRKELKVFTRMNVILVGIIIVVVAIFLVDILTASYKTPELNIKLPKTQEVIVPQAKVSYVDLDEETDSVVEKKSNISRDELVKDLVLLGIITGDEDQAVIEDKSGEKSYFLYKGDSFKDFTVYDIKESRVILDYRGEKIELKI